MSSTTTCSYVLTALTALYLQVMYSNMTLCVLAITGFYTRLPPYAFLLLVHVATALRAGLVLSLGSANTSMCVGRLSSGPSTPRPSLSTWARPHGSLEGTGCPHRRCSPAPTSTAEPVAH